MNVPIVGRPRRPPVLHRRPRVRVAGIREPWRLRLWIPVALLWCLVMPVLVLALPFLLVVERAQRLPAMSLIGAAGSIIGALGGARIEVESPAASVRLQLF